MPRSEDLASVRHAKVRVVARALMLTLTARLTHMKQTTVLSNLHATCRYNAQHSRNYAEKERKEHLNLPLGIRGSFSSVLDLDWRASLCVYFILRHYKYTTTTH